MAMIAEEEKARLIALGFEGIMREIAEDKHCQPTSPYRDAVDALLASVKATEESAIRVRIEGREEEAIAVAREANDIARDANRVASRAERWAMYAAIAAVIALIISITNITK
jgi:hypothetical protein